jgi:hypothetical protein
MLISPFYSGPESDPTIIPGTYTPLAGVDDTGTMWTYDNGLYNLIGSSSILNEKLVISTSPYSVPDGGSTLLLLGVGCLGMVCVRSKLRSLAPKAGTVSSTSKTARNLRS